jgi:hypothetical protein
MADEDVFDQAEKQQDVFDKAAYTQPTFMDKAIGAVKNVGAGALKGAGHTLTGLAPLINKIPGIGETLSPSEGIKAWEQITKPQGTAQNIGFGAEQVGEMLLPGLGEEGAAAKVAEKIPMLGKAALPAAKIATSALSTGGVNKLQGGSFTGGAALGAAGGAIGEAGKAIAPSLAESALGVTRRLRGFGRTPGESALEEIGGIRPGTVAAKAQEKLTELTSQLEQAASRSTLPATTQPAIDVVTAEMQKAAKQNNKTLYTALKDLHDQLTVDFTSGQALPSQMPASRLLDLKRGIGDLEGNWNPELRGKLKGIVRQVYWALDKELDRTVPEADKLNQRISSLIPVKGRAESVERGADITQRFAHRVAAHTGALLPSIAGGYYGYEKGGPIGAAAGIALPELLASPSGQMLGARVLNSPFTAKAMRAAGSQLLQRKSEGE